MLLPLVIDVSRSEPPRWPWLVYFFLSGLSAFALIFWLTVPLMLVVGKLSHWRTKKRFPVTVQLTAEGVETSTAVHRSQLRWAAFDAVVVTRRRLFLFLTRRSALIVPRRAFPADPEWQSFVKACQDGVARGQAEALAEKCPQ